MREIEPAASASERDRAPLGDEPDFYPPPPVPITPPLFATRLLIGQAHSRQGTPTPLGGVSSGGVCCSAHRLTSDRVSNGDRVESEAGRGRRPLPADWLRRDAMPTLDSAHAHACWLTCARRMLRASWCQDGREDGVVGVVAVVVVVVVGDGVFQ